MVMPSEITEESMAVCGVNCLACSAYLHKKNPCPGCVAPKEKHVRKSCRECAKKECAFEKGIRWCFECGSFPCSRIKSLSKRYVSHHGVDLIENGVQAQGNMDAFLAEQQKRFSCKTCGGIIDQHHKRCSECGAGE